MRIAFFTYADPTEAGGVQEYTYQLSRALTRRGHYVAIFGPEGRRILPYKNYHTICRKIAVPSANGSWSPYTLPFMTKPSAAEIINRGHFDILHLNDPWIPFVSYDLIGNVRTAKVATLHNGWDKTSPVSGLMKLILPMVRDIATNTNTGVIFVSEHARRCWQPMFDKSVSQKIILHGVDESFKPNGWRPATTGNARLLFVGRLVKRKGLQYLLEAINSLVKKYPSLRLDVVGDGRERSKLNAYTLKHHLTKNIKFHGQIIGKDRIEFYQKAQIFCAPYGNEGFGLTMLEAMASGVPIVGFKNGAYDEMLASYPDRKLMVARHTGIALSKALKQLIEDRPLQEKIREWSLIEGPKYTWDKTAGETEKFYLEILRKKIINRSNADRHSGEPPVGGDSRI